MFITKRSLSRRTVLRGFGATLALPLLDAMAPALAARGQAGAAAPVARLGFFYAPNGMYVPSFVPTTAGRDFEFSPILKPLEPFRNQVTVVTGLSNARADTFGEAGGPHTRCHATWLSGVRPKRTEGADIQAGMTIDQHAAQELGRETQLLSLELALEPNYTVGNCDNGYSCVYVNSTSWRSPTMPLPMENNPRTVFERLFGEENTPLARRAQMRKDRSILDAVRDDMSLLQRTLGPSDRRTIEEYLGSIREVERRIQKVEEQSERSPNAAIDQPVGIPPSFEEHASMMLDLQFLAYQTDITRVATLQIAREQSERTYPELGVPEAHHDISHHQNNPERIAKNSKVNVHHLQLFSRLVKKMQDAPDGDGSLLDHAILMYGCGMGDGDHHSPHNLPTVLVGGGCGTLKGGRHLKYSFDTPLMNLGLSLLDKVGVSLDRLGDSTGHLTDL
jgi:hypothetical protein